MVELDALCFGPEFRFDARAMQRFAEGRRAHTVIQEGAAGEMVGFAIVELVGGRQGRSGYCVTLDVAPVERRRGAGEALLRVGEQWLADSGADRMQLHVWAKNEGAIRFYERLGYVLRGTVPQFYGGPGMDALVYDKRLRAEGSAGPLGDERG